MANTVQYITNEYNIILEGKINSIKDDLFKIERNLKFHSGIILKYEAQVYPNDIVDYIKQIRDGISSYNKYKANELYRTAESDELKSIINSTSRYEAYLMNNTLSSLIPIRYNTGNEKDEINTIASAYINFYRYTLKYHALHEQIIKYEKIQLPVFIINRFIKLYLIYASRFILRYKKAKFALPYSIYLYVYGKSRKQAIHKKFKVNWGETNRNLKDIAKRLDYKLYENYTEHRITKQEFYDGMKPYIYSADNPNGIKYLKYLDKDVNHWLIANTFYATISGIREYGITPTNFVENRTRSQIDFARDAKDIDEIVDSNHLGFRDKIRVLERFDMDFCRRNYLNNIEDDLQAS